MQIRYFKITSKYTFWSKRYTCIEKKKKIENVKSWYCGSNYSQWIFLQNAPSQVFDRALNLPGLRICLWFWICQVSEYARVLRKHLVLNMHRFWIRRVRNMLGLHRILDMLEYVWIFLKIPDYASKCLSMSVASEYTWVCLNLLNDLNAWLLIVYLNASLLISICTRN